MVKAVVTLGGRCLRTIGGMSSNPEEHLLVRHLKSLAVCGVSIILLYYGGIDNFRFIGWVVFRKVCDRSIVIFVSID